MENRGMFVYAAEDTLSAPLDLEDRLKLLNRKAGEDESAGSKGVATLGRWHWESEPATGLGVML
jgi:hypothetical protein